MSLLGKCLVVSTLVFLFCARAVSACGPEPPRPEAQGATTPKTDVVRRLQHATMAETASAMAQFESDHVDSIPTAGA